MGILMTAAGYSERYQVLSPNAAELAHIRLLIKDKLGGISQCEAT